jgi:hypothetical protein|tara:strand:- start:6 stop:263 length:258 start_codon:yes stop_codon:yes gene_type:complete
MTKRKSKAEKDEAEYQRTTKYVNHIADIVNSIRESDKEEMLDEICDPEPMSGYSLLDEMEFTLYAALADLNKLQKLIFLYKEQQE